MKLSLVLFALALVATSIDGLAQEEQQRELRESEARQVVTLDEQGRPHVGGIQQASQLLGKRVALGDGKELGTVEDLALDVAEGYVALVIVKPAKEADGKLLALPPYVLTPKDSGLAVDAKVTAKMLSELERLNADKWSEEANRAWACNLYNQFAVRAPWEDRRGGTWSTSSTYCQLYDPHRIKSLTGKIESIEYVAPQPGMALGTQLIVATDEGPRKVQLGPLWFMSRGNVSFERGEEVTVRGSEVDVGGNKFLMAASVTTGDKALELRQGEGQVVWPDWTKEDDIFTFAPFSKLQGTPVANTEGESLGKIDDLAVSTESGLIAYAALDSPELGEGKYIPIPLSAFVVKPNAKAWILELPEEIVHHTPKIERSGWRDNIDRSWVEYVHVRYGRSPFSGVRRELRAESSPQSDDNARGDASS